eukprot:610136_1
MANYETIQQHEDHEVDRIIGDAETEPIENTEKHIYKHRVTIIVSVAVVAIVVIIALIVAFVVIWNDVQNRQTANCMNGKKVVIISLDGFAFNYLNKRNISMDNINYYFKQNGVYFRDGLVPTFPTETYSTHYSIFTGMYPPFNGIVSNAFYDKSLNDSFNIRTHKEWNTTKWYKGEPIWNTIKINGLNTAAFYMPGSLSNCSARSHEMEGYPEYHYKKYIYDWSFMEQLNKSIEFLTSTEPIYDLIALYNYQPDYFGHKYGPNSIEVKQQIAIIDAQIGAFMKMLNDNDLMDQTDVILLSDHGMTDIEHSKQIVIDTEKFDFDDVAFVVVDSSLVFLYLNELQLQNITQYMAMIDDAIQNDTQYYNIYGKGDMPYGYDDGGYVDRIPDIMVESRIGYTFYKNSAFSTLGNHGWNNSEIDMRAIVFATGPSFKSGYVINNSVESVHLYPLFCHLLCDVNPNPSANGSIQFTNNMLL